jgi:DNA-binding transcriptional LysR family regulator
MNGNHIDWDKLKTFYHVVNAGSITAASNKLNLSQSALSRQISVLEDRLGVKLFERAQGRGGEINLTSQGKVMYDSVCKIFMEIDSATRLVHEEDNLPKGPLKVSTTVGLAATWIMDYIPGFLEQHPEIELSIIGTDEPLDLHLRKADVAIRTFIEGNTGLIQDYLMTFHIKLFASKGYLKKYGTPQSIKDLDHHRLIVFSGNVFHPYDNIDWILREGCDMGESRKPYMVANSTAMLHQAAVAGLGIASFSKEHVNSEMYAKDDLVEILPEVKGPEIKLYYIYPKQVKDSKRIHSLKSYLTEAFKGKDFI